MARTSSTGAAPAPKRSISTKLAIVMMATALLSASFVSLVGLGLLRQAADRIAIADLKRQADSISTETALLQRNPSQVVRFLRRALNLSGAALYRIEQDGSLSSLGGTPTVLLTRSEVASISSGVALQGIRSFGHRDFVFVAEPIVGPGNGLLLVLGRDRSLAAASLPIGRRLFAASALAVSIAALASFYLSRRFTKPLTDLAEAASHVATGDFETRVPVETDDEIGVVASTFNNMTTQLGDADKQQREFFLSISHELRTPLTAIQGYAEAIEDQTATGEKARDAAGVILSESKRLTRLVSDLLDLARIDADRFKVDPESIEAVGVLNLVKENFELKATEAGVAIEVRGEPSARVTADRDRLVQVLSNLVENGLRYTPEGGTIILSCSIDQSVCTFDVTDGGVGLVDEDLARAFERQYLWGKYRGIRDVGTGLGLAITKELVEAMGGTVRASRSAESSGLGARFTVELPA